MSMTRQPGPRAVPREQGPAGVSEAKLVLEDVLASSRRLWLRGRLIGVPLISARSRPWWRRAHSPDGQAAHLETYVSGKTIPADVPLDPEGRFEALLAADLPPARRGWRTARHKLTFGNVTVEGCTVVLLPPAAATAAVVVVLPLAGTYPTEGPAELACRQAGGTLGPLLVQLMNGADRPRPLYYLACVPEEASSRQRDLALAIASLGWPSGQVVTLPAPFASAAALTTGVDRLRWLFAGALDLLVLNREPQAADLLRQQQGPAEDRASITALANPEDPAWEVLLGPAAARPALLPPNLRPSRASRVTRFPIVFCHGMLAFSTLRMQLPEDLNSFSALREPLRQRGFRALFPQVLPTGGITARAEQLRDLIRRWTDEPFNIIAHSMGGLDARYLITHLGMADRVRSLTTISTPHRGTWLADWFISNYRHRVPLLVAMETMGINVDGFADCRPAACALFNAQTPDAPSVRYFSYGGAVPHCRVSPVLRRPWCLLTPIEGPNDGMVSVASAHWGEYLGTLEADHFAQTPDAVFLHPGEDFDALGFYLNLVEDLAYRGF
jgi:triacylglycerol lipase